MAISRARSANDSGYKSPGGAARPAWSVSACVLRIGRRFLYEAASIPLLARLSHQAAALRFEVVMWVTQNLFLPVAGDESIRNDVRQGGRLEADYLEDLF